MRQFQICIRFVDFLEHHHIHFCIDRLLQLGERIHSNALVRRVILLDEISTSKVIKVIAGIHGIVNSVWKQATWKDVCIIISLRSFVIQSDLSSIVALAWMHSVLVQASSLRIEFTHKKLKMVIENFNSFMRNTQKTFLGWVEINTKLCWRKSWRILRWFDSRQG